MTVDAAWLAAASDHALIERLVEDVGLPTPVAETICRQRHEPGAAEQILRWIGGTS